MNTPASRGDSHRRRLLALSASVLVLLVGVLGVFWMGGTKGRPTKRFAPGERERRLAEKKNIAIAAVETEQYDLANRLFAEIADEAPGDPLGPRNLAIARVLNFERTFLAAGGQLKRTRRLAVSAVNRVKRIRGQEAIGWRLQAEIARIEGDVSRQTECLSRAAELSPDEATIWVQLAEACRFSGWDRDMPRELTAWQRAAGLAPDSFFVHRSLLETQAELEDPAIGETLERVRPWLSMLSEPSHRKYNFDLVNMHAEAMNFHRIGDWKNLKKAVLRIANVTKPNPATWTDSRRMTPYPMNWLLREFQPSTNARSTRVVEMDDDPAVRFEAHDLLSAGKSADAVDVLVTDLDLDGLNDIVVLSGGKIEAFSRQAVGDEWQSIAACDSPPGFNRVMAAAMFRGSVSGDTFPSKNRPSKRAARYLELQSPGDESRAMAMPIPDGPPAHDRWMAAGGQTTFQNLLVYCEAGIRVLLYDPVNNPKETALTLVRRSSDFENQKGVTSAAPIDFDADGDLDLALLSDGELRLWRNQDDADFTAWNDDLPAASGRAPFADLTAIDFDRDIDIDLLFVGANDGARHWLENKNYGRFQWRTIPGQPLPRQAGRAIAVGEFDGSPSWDVVVAGDRSLSLLLTDTTNGGPRVKSIASISGKLNSRSLAVCDFDNDASPDVLALGEQRLHLYRVGVNRIAAWKDPLVEAPQGVIAFDIGDLDADGDWDIVCLAADSLVLLDNEGGNHNGWLDARLVAEDIVYTGPANHYGLGSVVELRRGLRYQAISVDRQTLHFGLGPSPDIDSLRVLWPSGFVDGEVKPPSNRTISQGLPYH